MSSLAHAYDPHDAARPWLDALARDGYCIVPGLLPQAKVRALHNDLKERFARTPFCQGDFYGGRTKRFGGLLKRSVHAEAFVMHPLVLALAEAVLGPFCDRFQLNLTQALEIHQGQTVQAPHRDQDMWRGEQGRIEYLINVMWPFTPYRRENGATLVWPGSHKTQNEPVTDFSGAVAAEMDPGAALIFLGSTLHGAGANTTPRPRAGMIISYCLGWLKPYENQWLVYPPEIARHFPPDVAAMVGYQQHRPNLGNYEGQCPSVLLKGDLPDYLAAIDEMRPDQLERLAAFTARQAAAKAGP